MERNIGNIMAIKNDERILSLREQIEAKKKTLGKQPRFSPITTCIIDYNGERINLHTMNTVRDIDQFLVCLNMWVMSAENLGVNPADIMMSGFSIVDWMDDLRSKREVVVYQEEAKKLNALNKQLEKLLSDDKKTELEIDAIAELLG
jgi:hypothetical protein